MGDDKITALPVAFKEHAPAERSVSFVHEVKTEPCCHLFATYLVSESAAEVECGKCGAKLNPMWVLARLASEDQRMHTAASRFEDEMQRLEARMRVKCDQCGKMTRIRRY